MIVFVVVVFQSLFGATLKDRLASVDSAPGKIRKPFSSV